MKYILGISAVMAFFLLGLLAESPSRLDIGKEERKPELVEIEIPIEEAKKIPDPEPALKIEDSLAALAPESFSSDPGMMDSGFGVGYGSGGAGFGTGSGGLHTANFISEKTSVDRSARVIQRSPPEYPSAARNKGMAGEVIVKVRISSNGIVEEVKVEKADPPGIFEESAIKAIKNWRFEPAFQKGQAVAAWVTQKIRYELN